MITERRINEGMNHFLKDPELSDKRTIKLTQIQMLMNNILIILFTFLTFGQNACSQQTRIDEKL